MSASRAEAWFRSIRSTPPSAIAAAAAAMPMPSETSATMSSRRTGSTASGAQLGAQLACSSPNLLFARAANSANEPNPSTATEPSVIAPTNGASGAERASRIGTSAGAAKRFGSANRSGAVSPLPKTAWISRFFSPSRTSTGSTTGACPVRSKRSSC